MNGFIFQSRNQVPLLAIVEQVTCCPYSHCGIIHGDTVIESIETVQETPLDVWIAQGRGSWYSIYSTGDGETDRLAYSRAKDWLGLPYDMTFDLYRPDSCFCSKLLYYGLQEAGYWSKQPLEIKTIKEYDLGSSWEKIVAAYAELGVTDLAPCLENYTVSPSEIASRLRLVATSFPPKPPCPTPVFALM